jgi:hypothetical protein
MHFRAFLKRDQNSGDRVIAEGTFRAAMDATRQQKARVERQAAEQGQMIQQASDQHELQQAVEQCGRLVEFDRDVEEVVQTRDMSVVQQRATTVRGAASGLLGLLRQLAGTP